MKCAPSVRIAQKRNATPASPTAQPSPTQSHSFPGSAAPGTYFVASTPSTSPASCHAWSRR